MKRGEVVAVIAPGRTAERVGEHHAVLTCTGCHWSVTIERVDEEPLTNSDVSEAVLTFVCGGCGS